MPNVVSIYDDPEAWQYVYIVPYNSILTYKFLAQVSGGHDSKIERQNNIKGKGAGTVTRGRKGAQIDVALTIQDTDAAGRQTRDWLDYQSMVNLLTGEGSSGTLFRHRVLHPALQGMGYRQHLYIKRIGVPRRNSGKDPLVSVLTWLEDLPPAPGDGDDKSPKKDPNAYPTTGNPPLQYSVIQSVENTNLTGLPASGQSVPPTQGPQFSQDPSTSLAPGNPSAPNISVNQ